jgi:hypothetical protein
MYGQRGIAELLNICKDIREVAAKDCLLLNYANPMAMLTWAANKYGGVKTKGLCHGVQHGHQQIALSEYEGLETGRRYRGHFSINPSDIIISPMIASFLIATNFFQVAAKSISGNLFP